MIKSHLFSNRKFRLIQADDSFFFFGYKALTSEDDKRSFQNPEPQAREMREKNEKGCGLKLRAQRLLKFRAMVSCLYPTAEGMPTIYIPTLSQ